jgi:hypothetical protein
VELLGGLDSLCDPFIFRELHSLPRIYLKSSPKYLDVKNLTPYLRLLRLPF